MTTKQKAVAQLALAAVVLGVLYLVAYGHGRRWHEETLQIVRPQIAEPTKRARKAHRAKAPLELCADLTVIDDAKLLAEVARRHGLPDLDPGRRVSAPLEPLVVGRSLLTLADFKPAPYGGEIAVTVAPGETEPVVSVVPKARPWFEVVHRWGFEAGVGYAAQQGADGTSGTGVAALFGVDYRLVRTGRVTHGIRLAGIVPQSNPVVFAGYTVTW